MINLRPKIRVTARSLFPERETRAVSALVPLGRTAVKGPLQGGEAGGRGQQQPGRLAQHALPAIQLTQLSCGTANPCSNHKVKRIFTPIENGWLEKIQKNDLCMYCELEALQNNN